MKNTNLGQLSVEALQKQQKLLKTSNGLLIGISIVLAGAIIFLLIRKGSTAITISLIVVLSSLLTLSFTNKKSLDDIKAEIGSREASA